MEQHDDSGRIRPFEIAVSDDRLADLRQRLARTRLPDRIPGTGWRYGTDYTYLEELLEYWQHEFDWRAQERRLNRFDQYVTGIGGLDLHFIHQRSADPDAIPLLVVHGWPGSISEFSGIIGPLTDPRAHGDPEAPAFHVIAPSLPGFGFSGRPDETGYNPERMAHVLAVLMERLGHERYLISGGDWGAIINRHLAWNYPERVAGLHSNMLLAPVPEDEATRAAATAEELELRQQRQAFMADERAYQQIQGSKPQSLGVGLNDSPAGLAAWIVEKFHGWTELPQRTDGHLDDYFSKDQLLTNIAIYWFTETITSASRIYYENRNVAADNPIGYIKVPTGAAIFPAEIFVTPRAWAEASHNIVHWTVMPEGGHFAALEQPGLLVDDLRAFQRALETR